MTELAYLANSDAGYVRSFPARVTALPPGAVVLDRTFFYPAGGGQRSDRGTLRTAEGSTLEVVDVTKSGTTVVHRIGRSARAGLTVGAEVTGTLDWPRRHLHMRLHTGQHLLSALVFRQTGLRTRQASMTETSGVIDLESAWPSASSVEALAAEAAAHVAQPLAVRILQVPRSEWSRDLAPRSGLVALPPHVDPVRVIDIAGVDRCPCGGTHVRSTEEIGSMRLDPPVPAPGGGSRIAFTLDASGPSTPPA